MSRFCWIASMNTTVRLKQPDHNPKKGKENMKTEFTEKQEKAVKNICESINDSFRAFTEDAEKTLNKSAAIRARKKSLVITQMLKAYRSLSIK